MANEVRRYLAPEGSDGEVMTAVGPTPIDATDLPADQIVQLERMVTSGMLEAEGPEINLVRELDPSKEHMLENRVTQAAAMRRPYQGAQQKLQITQRGGSKVTGTGGSGVTTRTVDPGQGTAKR
jgi:hypothetical protein